VINGLGTGGAERSTAEMLPRFRDAGMEPAIACLYRREQGVESQLIADGFDVRFLPGGRLSQIRALRRWIEEDRPDLVHTSIFDADLVGRVASWRKAPVLSSLVNTTYDQPVGADPNVRRMRIEVVKLLDGLTARHLVSHFHAITHAVKGSAVRHLRVSPELVTVVERGRDPGRLGVPSDERRRRVRTALAIDERDEVLVHVGRHEYQKGIEYLLRAVASLSDRSRLVLLQLGRPGNASDRLRTVVDELALGDRVRFLGHRDDVPDVLSAADVFVFPSLYEGLGGAVIEAMALGLPIVCSDLPALREVVEERGDALLAARNDPDELAAAIRRVLDDVPTQRQFAARSRAIFEERFTLDRSADRMLELYDRVAGQVGAHV
jgi:glycosyltransferase involved in cell wall biosynthesis